MAASKDAPAVGNTDRPDEEGIKTAMVFSPCRYAETQTDLMKKA